MIGELGPDGCVRVWGERSKRRGKGKGHGLCVIVCGSTKGVYPLERLIPLHLPVSTEEDRRLCLRLHWNTSPLPGPEPSRLIRQSSTLTSTLSCPSVPELLLPLAALASSKADVDILQDVVYIAMFGAEVRFRIAAVRGVESGRGSLSC